MTHIPAELRRLVIDRAGGCCECCLMTEADSYLAHEVDHIISNKHRGDTTLDNLCLSCFDCNRYKGSDIGSYDIETETFVSLYNPRTMYWNDHFRLDDAVITPLTPEARVTVFLLRLNSGARLVRRAAFLAVGRYPCSRRPIP
ncbi:MAG: HNH endonuclease [Chloroflexi bacterium]|nr:HNH endonuclease [Chloroflexota bacterium]